MLEYVRQLLRMHMLYIIATNNIIAFQIIDNKLIDIKIS